MTARVVLIVLSCLPSLCVPAGAQPAGQSSHRHRALARVTTPEVPGDWAVRFDYQRGVVGRSHRLPRDIFHAYRLELLRQTDGSADWHHTYHFPAYGMGIHLGDFGSNPVDRGVPVSVYGFLQLPLLRITETTDLFTSFGLGVAHGWNTPTFEEFPFERHPTSPMTSYLDLGLYGRQRLSVRVDLLGGFSMNHFSNGGAHNPNRGLTVKAPRVALQYSLGDRGPRRRRSGLAPFTERWVTRVDGGFAVKGVGFVWTGESFTPRGSIAIGTFKGSVWRRYYRNGQVGGGLEVSYESGRQPREAASPEADLRGGASLAAFTGYEQLFGRVSIYVQVGAHLTRTRRDERPATFQRVGFIQRFSERWFADVGFRFFNSGKDFSHDFIAWHLGYQL